MDNLLYIFAGAILVLAALEKEKTAQSKVMAEREYIATKHEEDMNI